MAMDQAADIFTGGMDPSDGRPYLGRFETVDGMVRDFVSDVTERLAAGDGPGIVDLLEREARIFAGQEPGYALIPGWHTQTQLGQYLAARMQVDGNQPLIDILRTAFGLVAQRVIDAAQEMASGSITDDTAQFRVDVLAEEITAALTGTWEIVYPAGETA